MLSSVLRSSHARQINIAIMRTFVRLCNLLSTNDELARKVQEHDKQIGVLYQHLQQLLEPPDPPKRNLIGFKEDKTKKT